MGRRISILSLLWLSAAAANTAEQGAAPLEGAKQELKRLQADQATQSSGAAGGKITEGLPQVQTPVPAAVQLEKPSSEKAEQELRKKRETQKNWLRDGVDQLGKGTKARGRETGEAAEALADEEQKQFDSSDPDYMLKLYTAQKKTDDARAGQMKPTTPRVDPLAPFLQGWLETSPVRGKFFDDFVRKPDAGGAFAGGPVPAEHSPTQGVGRVEITGSAQVAPATAQTNPYLQGLDTLTLQDLGSDRNQSVAASSVFINPVPVQPSGGLVEPISAGRPAEKKPLPLPPSDDKKYFPQLKKF